MKIISILTLFCTITTLAQSRYPQGVSLNFDQDLLNKKICFIGDSGSGKRVQKNVAKSMVQFGCDQIRHTGDIVYDKGITNMNSWKTHSRFWRPNRSIFKGPKKIKMFLSLGNHDYKSNPDAWLDLAKANPEKVIIPSRYYSERWRDICFVTLDTTPIDKQMPNENIAQQLEWFKQQKSNMKKWCRFSILIAHHFYISSGDRGDSMIYIKNLVRSEILGSFDLHIAGHDHNLADEGAIKKTRFLVSGGGGAEIRALKRTPTPPAFAIAEYGFIALTLKKVNDKIVATYQIITVPAKKWKTAGIVHSGQIDGQGIR